LSATLFARACKAAGASLGADLVKPFASPLLPAQVVVVIILSYDINVSCYHVVINIASGEK
jgi:hypothetical protein